MSPRRAWLALALAAALLAAPLIARAAEEEFEIEAEDEEKDVFVLTDANFDATLKKHKYALVEFYAPWCGHCKNLAPHWAKAATTMKAVDPSVLVAKVDATEQKAVAARFSVQGFPTIKWFVDGKEAADYGGGRTADDIVRYLKKRTGPPSEVLADDAALERAKGSTVAVFGYFAAFDGADHAAFEALAAKSDDATFFKTADAALAAKLGLASPGFMVGRNYEGHGFEAVPAAGHAAMAGAAPLGERLEALLAAEKLPDYLEFSQATSGSIFNSGVNHQVIVYASGAALAPGAAAEVAIRAAAKKTRGRVVFVTTRHDSYGEGQENPIVSYFGLDKAKAEPQVVGFFTTKGTKFNFKDAPVNGDTLAAFAEAVVAGTAPKFHKSAPKPAEPTDEGVTVVVGDTVASIVQDPTRDVLLEVYAPWCGHCKSLAPEYAKLAKRFRAVDSVVIAKMDGTENEHPDVEAQGFPTLLFFPAEAGAAPIPYSGERTLLGMTKFIKEHAKVPFELPKKKKDAAAGGDDAAVEHDEL